MMLATLKRPDGKTMLLMGITKANLKELTKGNPMKITRGSHGLAIPENLEITLMYGEDEKQLEAIVRAAGLVSQKTTIIRDPRLNG